MKLRWTMVAVEDLESIYRYLQHARPADLHFTIARLYAAAQSLRRLPGRGHAGAEPGTLELVLLPLPYVIIYRFAGEVVEVLGFRHTSQDVIVH